MPFKMHLSILLSALSIAGAVAANSYQLSDIIDIAVPEQSQLH